MQGKLPAFFEEYLEYARDTECAEEFNLWCAISAVGALAQPKLWLWYGSKRILLHQYICLVAPSGHRKSESIDVLMRIINMLDDIPTAPDRITERSILDCLARNLKEDVQVEGQSQTINYCSMYIVAPEFASLFEARNMNVLTFLTRIYDSKEGIWSYVTGHMGEVHIERPSVSILAGSTPEWLAEMMPHSAIGGGFTNRFHFIYNEEPLKRVAFPQSGPNVEKRVRRCAAFLRHIQQRTGEIQWTPKAMDFYRQWYESLEPPNPAAITRGWEARLPFFLLQLSAIACLADDRKQLLLEPHDLEWALSTLLRVKTYIKQCFDCIGRNPLATVQNQLLKLLRKRGDKGVLRSEIFFTFSRDIQPFELKQLLAELLNSNIVEVRRTGAGLRYYITSNGMEETNDA